MSEDLPSPRPTRGLGRGLSSLLGESAPVIGDSATPQNVPIELIRRNAEQPRKYFDESEIEALAQSIRVQGVLQPILVRPLPDAPGEYQIVAGERRWRAAQRAGLHTIPVVVRDLDDRAALELGILENVQRQDLNAIEEAAGYATLIQQFGRTQDEIAQGVGKSRSHIANLMRLLSLPNAVRDMVMRGELSAGHARALLGAENPEVMARQCLDKGWSVRQIEAVVRAAQQPADDTQTVTSADIPVSAGKPSRKAAAKGAPDAAPASPVAMDKDPDTMALEADIASVLGLYVDIRHFGPAGGDVTIRYETLEQLDDICRRLSRHTV